MLLAIDYDGTYTLDPDAWGRAIDLFMSAGHQVVCATMRHRHEGADVEASIGLKCKVIYTGRKAKKPALLSQGYKPDIWIDDSPGWIFSDSL